MEEKQVAAACSNTNTNINTNAKTNANTNTSKIQPFAFLKRSKLELLCSQSDLSVWPLSHQRGVGKLHPRHSIFVIATIVIVTVIV